jgi:hypothetical protein
MLLEALGARRWDHQQERGFDFWVMRDPWENEFCILQSHDPNVIAQREPSGDEPNDRAVTAMITPFELICSVARAWGVSIP